MYDGWSFYFLGYGYEKHKRYTNNVFIFIHSGLTFKVLLEKVSKDEEEIWNQEKKKKGKHMNGWRLGVYFMTLMPLHMLIGPQTNNI